MIVTYKKQVLNSLQERYFIKILYIVSNLVSKIEEWVYLNSSGKMPLWSEECHWEVKNQSGSSCRSTCNATTQRPGQAMWGFNWIRVGAGHSEPHFGGLDLFHGCPSFQQMLLLLLFKAALQKQLQVQTLSMENSRRESWLLYFPAPHGSYLETKRGNQIRYCGCQLCLFWDQT